MFAIGSWPSAGIKEGSVLDPRPWHRKFFQDFYAPLLCQPMTQLAALILLTIYITGAVFGILRLRIGFEIENLLVRDSPSLSFVHKRFKYYGDLGKNFWSADLQRCGDAKGPIQAHKGIEP